MRSKISGLAVLLSLVLATSASSNNHFNAGDLSLREAIGLANAGVGTDQEAEVYWVLRPHSEAKRDHLQHATVVVIVNTPGSVECPPQGVQVSLAATSGLNILKLSRDDGYLLINELPIGQRLAECFGDAARLVFIVGVPHPSDTSDGQGGTGRVQVVGGFIVNSDGSSEAPIHYDDFSGTTVMYLDVTEDAN